MKSKILLFVLVIIMLLSAVGCQKTSQSSGTDTQTPAKSDPSASGDENLEEDTKLPDAEFTYFIPDQNAKIPPDDAPVMKQIYDLTGVRIKRIIPPAEPLERLNVMLATDDLPDLIRFDDPTVMKQFIDAGKIIPLNDLLEKNCPNVLNVNWATFDNRLYDDKGNLYFMPTGYLLGGRESAMPETEAGLSVRTGYFEEAGYDKIPKTWEQYKALLPQIKVQYPEMAPVSLALGAQGQLDAIIDIAGGAYGLEMSDRLVRSNDKLIYFTQSPEVKDFFAFLNSLNLEGYLDIESPVLSTEALKQKCVAAKVWSHIGHGWEIGSEVIAYESSNGSNEQMIYYIFPKANDSIEKVTYARSPLDMYNCGLTITTKCADPERFLKFYDYCNTEEGHFNILGTVNWEFTGENTFETTENYNFIVRQDALVDGKPRVEFTEWTGEMWAQDENWWWNWGVECMYDFTYGAGQLSSSKFFNKEDDVGMWWDENTTRINKLAYGWTGKDYFPGMKEMWIDTSEYAGLQMDPTSDEYADKLAIEDVYAKMLPKVIMANSSSEFESLWQAMEQELEKEGLQAYLLKCNELYQQRLAQWDAQ